MEFGIIAAMQKEAAGLLEKMQDKTETVIGGVTYTAGTLCGHTAVAAVCGVGKVFAALCAQTMILRFAPQCIINTGVAGSLSTALSIGDLVIADGAVQYDMDTSAVGDPVGLLSGINRIVLPTDKALTERLKAAAAAVGAAAHGGIVATGDRFVADAAEKRRIVDTFGAVACEMEGGAVAQACFVNGVPFALVRAISDDASGKAQVDYPAFADAAAKNSIALLCAALGGEIC